MNYKVSVFTCVYNGADTIHRVFSSVKSQTYKNIEHIIVDDGSTDGLDALVEKYISEVDYPVIYIKKTNGGKHTATNVAWDNAQGDFIIQLDADDELLPDAISFLVSAYESIPDEIKDEFWCVHGRCIDQVNRALIGTLYPENINSLPADVARRTAESIPGDKVGLMRCDKLDGYRYPEPACVKFVTESHLWHELNLRYRTWYTNEPVLVYYINEGESLSNPKMTRQTFANHTFNYKHELENRKRFEISGKALLMKLLFYIVYFNLSTEEYRKEYSYFLGNNDVLLNLLFALLFVPGKAAGMYFGKKWNVE